MRQRVQGLGAVARRAAQGIALLGDVEIDAQTGGAVAARQQHAVDAEGEAGRFGFGDGGFGSRDPYPRQIVLDHGYAVVQGGVAAGRIGVVRERALQLEIGQGTARVRRRKGDEQVARGEVAVVIRHGRGERHARLPGVEEELGVGVVVEHRAVVPQARRQPVEHVAGAGNRLFQVAYAADGKLDAGAFVDRRRGGGRHGVGGQFVVVHGHGNGAAGGRHHAVGGDERDGDAAGVLDLLVVVEFQAQGVRLRACGQGHGVVARRRREVVALLADGQREADLFRPQVVEDGVAADDKAGWVLFVHQGLRVLLDDRYPDRVVVVDAQLVAGPRGVAQIAGRGGDAQAKQAGRAGLEIDVE